MWRCWSYGEHSVNVSFLNHYCAIQSPPLPTTSTPVQASVTSCLDYHSSLLLVSLLLPLSLSIYPQSQNYRDLLLLHLLSNQLLIKINRNCLDLQGSCKGGTESCYHSLPRPPCRCHLTSVRSVRHSPWAHVDILFRLPSCLPTAPLLR